MTQLQIETVQNTHTIILTEVIIHLTYKTIINDHFLSKYVLKYISKRNTVESYPSNNGTIPVIEIDESDINDQDDVTSDDLHLRWHTI